MQIGKPVRTIFVEPLELPVNPTAHQSEANPVQLPEAKPEPIPLLAPEPEWVRVAQ